MKLRMMIIGLPLVLLLAAGCATKGRVSVLDLDLRDPEQITAGRFEAAVPYMENVSTNAPVLAKAEALPPGVWERILEVLKVIKCRVRILSIEWDERQPAQ